MINLLVGDRLIGNGEQFTIVPDSFIRAIAINTTNKAVVLKLSYFGFELFLTLNFPALR
ncbi:MAG: hypothetical protein HC941_30740 [Microcoleus sp. SU_5_3]|nr:hypothetical protein [Microcoleus sp. SU_5_3]